MPTRSRRFRSQYTIRLEPPIKERMKSVGSSGLGIIGRKPGFEIIIIQRKAILEVILHLMYVPSENCSK